MIFHLAAQLDVRVSVAKPLFDAEVNVLGSLNVCEAAIAAGTRKVVFAGSGGTLYGIPECCPCERATRSGRSRPTACRRRPPATTCTTTARCTGSSTPSSRSPTSTGRARTRNGEAGVVAIFAGRMLVGRQPTVFGDGAQTRDFVFVDDVVDAFVRATEKGGGLLMNIGTGVETSVLRALRRDGRARRLRGAAHRAPARPGELHRSALDPGRAAIHLGWKPWTSLDEGLGLTLDWFRDQPLTHLWRHPQYDPHIPRTTAGC